MQKEKKGKAKKAQGSEENLPTRKHPKGSGDTPVPENTKRARQENLEKSKANSPAPAPSAPETPSSGPARPSREMMEALRPFTRVLNTCTVSDFAAHIPMVKELLMLPIAELSPALNNVILKAATLGQTPLPLVASMSGYIVALHCAHGSSSIGINFIETVCTRIQTRFLVSGGGQAAPAPVNENPLAALLSAGAEAGTSRHNEEGRRLAVVLGSLYVYGLIGSRLVTGLLERLMKGTQEGTSTPGASSPLAERPAHVLMALALLSSCLHRLRKDDRAGLGQVAILAFAPEAAEDQKKSAAASDDVLRSQFFYETLQQVLLPDVPASASGMTRRAARAASKGPKSLPIRVVSSSSFLTLGPKNNMPNRAASSSSFLTLAESEDIRRAQDIVVHTPGCSDPEMLDVTWEQITSHDKKGTLLNCFVLLNDMALPTHTQPGRWWLVGMTYETQAPTLSPVLMSGRDATANPEATATTATAAGGTADTQQAIAASPAKVAALARELRMSTAARRAILTALVTAVDCDDAADKIQRMGLKGGDARDVAAVVVACAGQEKFYNPYYAHVASLLCRANRGHMRSFTNTLRDALRDLSKAKPPARRVVHTARLAATLIATDAAPLNIATAFTELGVDPELAAMAAGAGAGGEDDGPNNADPEESDPDEDDFYGAEDADVQRNQRERDRRRQKKRERQAKRPARPPPSAPLQALVNQSAEGAAANLSKHAFLYVQVLLAACCMARPLDGVLRAVARLQPAQRVFLGYFFGRAVVPEVEKLRGLMSGQDREYGHLSADEVAKRLEQGMARVGTALGAEESVAELQEVALGDADDDEVKSTPQQRRVGGGKRKTAAAAKKDEDDD
ncbi:putative nucleolar MIF4G domain-containing protein 1 [Paratrimastix pyriformis]|uniref:Nucleolar MIF4G domain-containing protein 1 n=1 Tax=Paratrimastix pyriformis TaxID=342808 RepID=A0ABQ8U1R6_9EUKA|nr:putative nucleolar MIF4G domain-containing protein 1 [Paratrimastix pyriformis]